MCGLSHLNGGGGGDGGDFRKNRKKEDNTGGTQVQSLTPPPPLKGQNVYQFPAIVQANIEKLVGAPLGGACKTGHPMCLCSKYSIFWWAFSVAPKTAGLVQPFLILSPCWGSLRRWGLCSHFDPCPPWGRQESNGDAAILINPHHADPEKVGVM